MRHCQYCGAETVKSYTCKECNETRPHADRCRCENNGDYCDACYEWWESRREIAAQRSVEVRP